jgi:3'-phosphoadenosine 5'-phosphosulfate sulfotransferase (PAPS reductase)/FAD synthetase
MSRRIVWFSCGAPSAVAALLTVQAYPETLVVYCDTRSSEHPDNQRFITAVSHWIGKEVKIIRSKKYASVDDVFYKERYMAGVNGARCTIEMKKVPRHDFQKPDDVHVFGFTVEEWKRAKLLQSNNPELLLAWPLFERLMTKADCLRWVSDAGIEIPEMYKLGFKNNNCIGCVKATSPAYWNRTRKHFPAIFQRRCDQSRDLGVRLVQLHGKRIFLDELAEEAVGGKEESIECGPQCTTEG